MQDGTGEAYLDEQLYNMGADETGCPSHKNSLVSVRHRGGNPNRKKTRRKARFNSNINPSLKESDKNLI